MEQFADGKYGPDFYDKLRKRFEEQFDAILKKRAITIISSRPKRATCINKDDINNLLIVLNTTSSVEEFVNNI